MSYLSMYLVSATPETKPILEAQHKELNDTDCFHCFTCDLKRHYSMGFKCLYCGAWFCFPCAEKHFNKTRQQWLEEQRVEKAGALREKMKPTKLKRRVFHGWMDVKNELPEKTQEFTQISWGNCRWSGPDYKSEYRVKITVEWKEGK